MAKVAVRGPLRPASAIWRQKWPSGALRGRPRGPTIREKLLLQPFKNVVMLLVLDRFGAQCLQNVAPTNGLATFSKAAKRFNIASQNSTRPEVILLYFPCGF